MTHSFSQEQLGPLRDRVEQAFEKLVGALVDARNPGGYWAGRLSDSALSTATAISALSCHLQDRADLNRTVVEKINAQIDSGLKWLSEQQNIDGGWGDTDQSKSNLSTTMLVRAAAHLSRAQEKTSEWRGLLQSAEAYCVRHGGVEGIRRRYGSDRTFSVPILANAAIANLVSWHEVGSLPFEATLVPQRFFHWMRLPVVSYAIPALVAIGQVKFVNDPPRNPIVRALRKRAVPTSLHLLERMQPASGGFLEAVPLTSFVAMGLIRAGQGAHAVVDRSIEFLLNSFRDGGSWPIDTNLATWNTSLSINAISRCWPDDQESRSQWEATTDWLLKSQHTQRHPFTNAAPGGWGWTDLSGAVPDADDTPGAMLALTRLREHGSPGYLKVLRMDAAIRQGVEWLVGLQNRDGGWPTFCRGWGRLPFDRSGADITAHVIRGLLASPEAGAFRVQRAIAKGFAFLDRTQQKNGSWLPLWFGNQDETGEANPYYGTAKVLLAYHEAERSNTKACQNGLNWIRNTQQIDGSWGGGESLLAFRQKLDAADTVSVAGDRADGLPDTWQGSLGSRPGSLGSGSLEETSLCCEALLAFGLDVDRVVMAKALDWICRAVDAGEYRVARPIGLYFAKLWYYEQHYPLVFGLGTLGMAKKWLERTAKNS